MLLCAKATYDAFGAALGTTLLTGALLFQAWIAWDARRIYLATATETERMRARTKAMEETNRRRGRIR
jgi:hypothetical protein